MLFRAITTKRVPWTSTSQTSVQLPKPASNTRAHTFQPNTNNIYLRDLPLLKTTDRWTYVHASLAEPSEWYYVDSPREALLHFREQRTPVAFCGHTHRPLVWLRDKSGELAMEQPRAVVALNRPAKYLVNVGSVGQNRDRDPRACYTIFDTDNNAIQFRRISYDVRVTQKKILAAGLPKVLAWRLGLGL